MSLRYRLFLWISSLLLLAGATTFILEIFVTSKELERTREELRLKINTLNEKKREHIESFLASSIGENQARIDVLLERLSSYPLLAATFAPTEINYEKGTWLNAAHVLHNNNWLDFIQNTNQDKLSSLIIPRISALDPSYRVEINDDLAWILMGDLSKHKEPYLGVRIQFSSPENAAIQNSNEVIETKGQSPKAYLLFTWKEIFSPDSRSLGTPIFKGQIPPFQTNLDVPWSDGSKADINQFFSAFSNGRQYMMNGLSGVAENQPDAVTSWIEKEFNSRGENLSQIAMNKDSLTKINSPFLRMQLEELVMRYDQLYMVWCLALLNDIGVFGNDLFSSPSPRGIAVHFGKSQYGEGIHTRDVFFPKSAFDDRDYYAKGAQQSPDSNISSHIAVFQPLDASHIYFGNTAQYRVKDGDAEKLGYLTLAMDADVILQRLVLATHQTSLLVTNGKLMGAFSEEGKKYDLSRQRDLPIEDMLKKQSGVVLWGDDEYYFMQMTPFSDIDMHFFLINSAAKEFALLNSLSAGAEKVISGILMSIHIIGLTVLVLAIFILHYLARRITHPITKLALATNDIAEGRLDEVEIPIPSESDTDEVASLCRSFEHMVKGLKEKEKVKAVLNKVVSQEIAQEILKGNIHLGGEEKKVTILFADIRSFTKMTQNMSPMEVIDLLNGCMTKISYFVDQHGGVIDKYVGDEAMALFGAPVESADSAYKAVISAIGMVEALRKWNEQRTKHGLPPVEMGIGIHTGNVLAGNMGAENRLNYTVLGSNVNLASRLCSAANGMEILISESTLKEPNVAEKILYEEVPPMILKGFDMPVVVYRVKGIK